MPMSHALNMVLDVVNPQAEQHVKIEQQHQLDLLPAHHFHPHHHFAMRFQAYVSILELLAEPFYAQITQTQPHAHTPIHLI